MQKTYVSENIGSLPLFFGVLEHIGLSPQINAYYPVHGNWNGGDKGVIVSVWLCYILTLSDHRLCEVESWFLLHQHSLNTLVLSYGYSALDPKDFTDDRLGGLLSAFGDTEIWYLFMTCFSRNLLKLYGLDVKHVELDATIAQQYREVITDGLLQLGHSKQHRSGLPQIKMMLSNAAESNIPLLINTVGGNRADDGLYVPLIAQTRSVIGTTGILWQGDSKLGSLDNRYEIARFNDFYLTPASLVQLKTQTLRDYVSTHQKNEGEWTSIYLDKEIKGISEKVLIGTGFEVSIGITYKDLTWTERRLVVRSEAYATAQIATFNKQLNQANTQLNDLMTRKTGKPVPKSAEELLEKAKKILDKAHVTSFFTLKVETTTTTKTINAYKETPKRIVEIKEFTLHFEQHQELIEQHIDYLGYRVYLTNQSQAQLPLQKAVEAYRGEYKIERRIRNLKQEVCALLPLYLQKEDRIVGLVNLLTLLLQIVSVLEYRIAQSLKEEEQPEKQKMAGLYQGQPTLKTANPTISKIISAMSPIMLIYVMKGHKIKEKVITNQNQVTKRIMELIKLPIDPYEILIKNGKQK
jgi:transposase